MILSICFFGHNIQMSSVSSWNVDTNNISYLMEKISNDTETVLMKHHYALILEGDIFVIGRTNESPVSTAFVKDYAEKTVNVSISESCLSKQYVMFACIIHGRHNGSFSVKRYCGQHRLVIFHSIVNGFC